MTKRETTDPPDLGEEVTMLPQARVLLMRGLEALHKGSANQVEQGLVAEYMERGCTLVPNWQARTVKVFARGDADMQERVKILNTRLRKAAREQKKGPPASLPATVGRYQPGMGRLERRGSVAKGQLNREDLDRKERNPC